MPLNPGTRLGTFELVDLVGAGGMGEVYRARDTRLDRTVAIKVLPRQWADNPEMRQRFEREARTIASLNHPHICTLHDIGEAIPTQLPNYPITQLPDASVTFLVLEYLEGETLAERLKRGPLPLDEALQVAVAIADALDKAHRRGVTHRDLKPGNIFLARRGGPSDPPIPKLLDFGLASVKAAGTTGSGSSGPSGRGAVGGSPTPGGAGASAQPTDRPLTAQGAILGTLQYMAPEQLEGVEADARTDIFAFGVVLHEMVTGRKTFEGKSRVLLMSAIVTAEPPPLSSAQPATPPVLDHLVKTCLAKDPAERWQTARDLLAELQWIAAGGADTLAAAPASAAGRRWDRWSLALLAGAALLVAALVAPVVLYFLGAGVQEELRVRVPIQLSADVTQIVGLGLFDPASVAVAPDGHAIAFVARPPALEATESIYVRPIDAVTPQRLAGTEGATQPFWSADSRWIGFVVGGRLKKVEATGGPPQDICAATDFSGGAWNGEGTIVFGTAQGLFRVSAEGGTPEALTTLDGSEAGHLWPHFLPDGRRYLYLAWSGQASDRAIFAGALDGTEKTRVMAAESKAAYTDPGYLVFRRENAVYAQRFSARTLSVSGEPVRVADDVTASGSNGQGDFDVSLNGALVYYYGGAGPMGGPLGEDANWQLAWVDRAGRQIATVGPYGPYRGAEASPDGTRVAVHRHEATGGDVWIIEPRGAVTRLTFDASQHNSTPLWSPDGTRVVYSSLRQNKWGLYRTLSNGSGTEELLVESELPKAPMSWSPDGKRLVFWVQDPKTGGDLWVLPLEGDEKPAPLVATASNETRGQISPNGRWIAYTSNETQRNEIYVQPFPTGSGRWQVSTAGGDWPRWKRDGNELFFHALGNMVFVDAILSAPVKTGGAVFEASDPKEVVRTIAHGLPHSGGDYHTYDVSPDGERFLLLQFVPPQGADQAVAALGPDPPFGLVAALNWTSALEK
jgi:Tol biopolymer transport system component